MPEETLETRVAVLTLQVSGLIKDNESLHDEIRKMRDDTQKLRDSYTGMVAKGAGAFAGIIMLGFFVAWIITTIKDARALIGR